jgi:UMF1 family MFS transporter
MAAGSMLARLALDSREKRAWAMYDWANSAFWTTIIGAVFPEYYARALAPESGAGSEGRYALATTIALLIIAFLAPFLGTLADFRAVKKKFLGTFAIGGALAAACMFFVHPGEWLFGLILFGVANIGASGSVIFYDALLPHVADEDEVDRLSTSGFALGYVGGGFLLALNFLWITQPQWFGLPSGDGLSAEESSLPVRLAFLSVGVWWFLFSLPVLLRVPEPPGDEEAKVEAGGLIATTLSRLSTTFNELKRYRQAFRLLLAFLVYNDGILTIVRMAVLYAKSKDLGPQVVMGTFLLVQFVGIPFTFLFGQLAGRFGTKFLILTGLTTYCGITVLAFFMETATHFVMLGILVAMVQGGTQALSRSLFSSMIPRRRSGEFFAFFSVGEKFAGIFGPLLYAGMIYWTGSNQNAILSVAAFFIIGAWLLVRVDVAEGQGKIRAEEAAQST